MSELLEDKVALVTGGGSGIGRTTALAFSREGASVVVADTNDATGEETVHKIQASGGEALFLRCDVSKAADVERMINKTVDAYGRLDCAFNNAGVCESGRVHECTEEAWDRIANINLKGVWLCMKYEVLQLLKQERGVIVNMASAVGLVGSRDSSAYVASKHGVVGLTKAAALEYAGDGIRVNAVCPGVIRTALTEERLRDPDQESRLTAYHPLGRLGTPDEVAAAVLWLSSDAASFVTGHTLSVDGAWTAG